MEKLLENPEDIVLQDNQDLNEAMGKTPGRFLRWGIMAVVVFVVVLLGIAWFVRFPDIFPAQAILTTEQPPLRIMSPVSGKISELLVRDGEMVEPGDLLAVMDNTANRADMAQLDAFLEAAEKAAMSDQDVMDLSLPQNLVLGPLQQPFSAFSKRFGDYSFSVKNNPTRRKVRNLWGQIKIQESMKDAIRTQLKTQKSLIELAVEDRTRKKDLFSKGLISLEELENAKSAYLGLKQNYESLEAQIYNNNQRILDAKMQIDEIRQMDKEGMSTGLRELRRDLTQMKSQVADWKIRYLVTAPIAGRVSQSMIWKPQEFVGAEQEMMTIVPSEDSGAGKIIALAFLPSGGSAKVKVGMSANLRLDDYPFQEFGSVPLKVSKIALIPEADSYRLEMTMPEGLVSNYGKELEFRQQMKGVANVITEDRRILERIFDRLWSIINEQKRY